MVSKITNGIEKKRFGPIDLDPLTLTFDPLTLYFDLLTLVFSPYAPKLIAVSYSSITTAYDF